MRPSTARMRLALPCGLSSLTCDGEAQQIAVLFQILAMLALFVVATIDFEKSPASCRAIAESSLDDSHFFKATKCLLKRVMNYKDIALERRIREYLHTRVKRLANSGSRLRKNLMITGLMKCVYAIKKVLTEDIIQDCYKQAHWTVPCRL